MTVKINKYETEPVIIRLSDNNILRLKVDTKNYSFLKETKELFTRYSPGYNFNPKYQAGVWDGKISLFDSSTKEFPYGLLFDLVKMIKTKFSDVDVTVEKDVKSLFNAIEPSEYYWDLKWKPRAYQESCVRAICKFRKCIFRVGTSGGKSLILAYTWSNLFRNNLIKKQLIVVPNLNLITQFKNDWIDYGIDSNLIGEVYSDKKEWDKPIVISTWQSLQNFQDKFNDFDSIFVDECHGTRSRILSEILQKTPNAIYRIGCTGTMPEEELDDLNVRSYLGPIIKEYSAKFLKENGYISSVIIKKIILHYENEYKGDYHEKKVEIFQNSFRMRMVKDILTKINRTCLLLVTKVEDEGEYLKNYLLQFEDFKDYEIVFISGNMKKDEREYWRIRANNPEYKILLISTYPIFQAGVNLPLLSDVIFVAPSKSKIRVLQSVGRVLRLHENKSIANVYDIVDMNNKWFSKHWDIRERHYYNEDFLVEEEEHLEKMYKNEILIL